MMGVDMADGERNARAWLGEIVERAAVVGGFVDLDDADAVEAAEQWAQESPLSVEIRDGWYAAGAGRGEPAEFVILLSTGGPACRVWGGLNQYGEPGDPDCRLVMQWQDWGTPWESVRLTSEDEESALRWFAQTVVGQVGG